MHLVQAGIVAHLKEGLWDVVEICSGACETCGATVTLGYGNPFVKSPSA